MDNNKYIIGFLIGVITMLLCSFTFNSNSTGASVELTRQCVNGKYYIVATYRNGVAICKE